jgi:hypothetical protein
MAQLITQVNKLLLRVTNLLLLIDFVIEAVVQFSGVVSRFKVNHPWV